MPHLCMDQDCPTLTIGECVRLASGRPRSFDLLCSSRKAEEQLASYSYAEPPALRSSARDSPPYDQIGFAS